MSRVLVVDDEERITAFLARSLAPQGHTVVTASNGVQALAVLATQEVDLVLLDLVMPEMNGLQCLAAMAEAGPVPPVIVLSGVSDVAARIQALDGGASPSSSHGRGATSGRRPLAARAPCGTSRRAASAWTSTGGGPARVRTRWSSPSASSRCWRT